MVTCDNTLLPESINAHDLLLQERLQDYVRAATSDSTRRAYRNDLTHFKDWGGTIPCSPQLLCDYLVTYAHQLAVSTLQRRLAAISRAHNTLGFSNPVQTEMVRVTMRGIRRKHGTAQRQARPLVKEDILLMLTAMDNGLKAQRDAALLLIGFCGAFRRSELVGLNVEDLEYVREGLIIHLRHSKTDQAGEGRKLAIPYGRGHICPVKSLQGWLEASTITSGPIFRPMTKGNQVQAQRLSESAVACIIKERAEVVGITSEGVSGHSLRAGLATSAAQHGISTHKIRQQTGHASDAMLSRYIRDGDLFNGSAGGLF